MTGDLARVVVQGYTDPRASARQLLESGNGLEAALGMVALAYLVQAILTIMFMSGGFGIGGHMLAIMQQLVTFFLLSALIYGVGRLAGGTGTMQGAQLVVGWHALVTSLISPLAIGVSTAAFTAEDEGSGGIPPGLAFMAFVYVAISFWLMANYVAELHGFRSTWGVLGAIIGLTFACAILLVTVIGAFAPA
ncbi:MAG TPA: YIP1 family protein [Paracoccaceae bacterium]|nr:YIP1 family protein [Paracoccaceae bacterium]